MENIRCCLTRRAFIFLENRRPSESDIIRILEMFPDLGVHLSELGSMTFIYDEDTFPLLESVHDFRIPVRTQRIRHLLDCRDDQCF